jgi:hypothetical protein
MDDFCIRQSSKAMIWTSNAQVWLHLQDERGFRQRVKTNEIPISFDNT